MKLANHGERLVRSVYRHGGQNIPLCQEAITPLARSVDTHLEGIAPLTLHPRRCVLSGQCNEKLSISRQLVRVIDRHVQRLRRCVSLPVIHIAQKDNGVHLRRVIDRYIVREVPCNIFANWCEADGVQVSGSYAELCFQLFGITGEVRRIQPPYRVPSLILILAMSQYFLLFKCR